jgi:hypothetical protein
MMPSRQFSHRLHPDEDMPQTSTHSQPPTQILSTIAEGLEHATFGDIPEFDVIPPPNNVSTAAAGLSQNAGGTNSTQINEGAPPQSPPWAPFLLQVIQGNADPKQIQVEYSENEVVAEVELARVQ